MNDPLALPGERADALDIDARSPGRLAQARQHPGLVVGDQHEVPHHGALLHVRARSSPYRTPTGRRVAALAFIVALLCACSRPPIAAPTAVPSPTEDSTGPFPVTASWQRLAPALSRRTEVTAAWDGSRLHVAGGFAESAQTVTTVEVFDPATGAWSRGPDLPVGVNHAMAAALDGTVYVLGGYLGPGLEHPTARTFALRGDRWVELPAMPEPRAAGGAAALDGRIHVAGGVGPAGLAASMLVFDPAAESWSTAPGPPTRREHLGVAAAAGQLYVVGGRTGGIGTNLDAAEAYDPATGAWSTLPALPTPRGGMAATATTGGLVVAAGGEARETFDEVEAFDVNAGRWFSLPPLPTARHGLGVAAAGSTVYTVAGGPQPGFAFSDANEAIDLAGVGAG
jgi:non-specific serine/threonine protein kinase